MGCAAASDNITDNVGDAGDKTFEDLQTEIDNTVEDTLELEGTFTGSGKEITVNKTITIDGKGKTTIDAKSSSRAISVTADNVVLKNLNFINGKSTSIGGAIVNQAENLTILNCTFTNNYATNGGAVSCGNYHVFIYNSTFKDNYAFSGGAATCKNGIIENNIFHNNTAEDGGAISISGNSMKNYCLISNNTFESNSASNSGGAIYATCNNASITRSKFNKNTAQEMGGAIYVDLYASNITVENSIFTKNIAENYIGGGISWLADGGILKNSIFEENEVSETGSDGGAVFWSSANGLISNCTFNNNLGTSYGGSAILLNKNNNTIASCVFMKNRGPSTVSVVHIDNLSIVNCNFTKNNDRDLNVMGTNVLLDSSNFIDSGRIIITSDDLYSKLTVKNCNFENMHSADDHAFEAHSRCEFSNCRLANSSANHSVLSVWYGLIVNCTFEENTGDIFGAIYFIGEDFENISENAIINSTFKNNKAREAGGGLYAGGNATLIANSTFINNSAEKWAGGIYLIGNNIQIVNNTFANNTAKEHGGAISTYYNDGKFENNTFINNKAATFNDVYGNFDLEILTPSPYYGDKIQVKITDKMTNSTIPSLEVLVSIAVKDIYTEVLYDTFISNEEGIVVISSPIPANTYDASFTLKDIYFFTDNYLTIIKAPAKLSASALKTTYSSGEKFTVKLANIKNNNPLNGVKLALKVFTGSKSKIYYATTKNGIASFDISTVDAGSHKSVIYSTNTNDISASQITSSIVISKAKTTVSAPKVTAKLKKSKYFKVTVKNKSTKKAVKSIKVKLKVYTGKKSKTYTIKTDAKGVAKLNTKTLKVGKHKVETSSGDTNYQITAKSTITIKR